MVKVYLTGGSSLLGRYLINTMPDDVELIASYYNHDVRDLCENPDVTWEQLDLCQPLGHITYHNPDIIIHAAALGSVDYCETHKQHAYNANYVGTTELAKVARQCGAHFVYISTNAVYSGTTPFYGAYSARHPVNYYGALKKDSEDIVRLINPLGDRIIIRPIMLYGWPWDRIGVRDNWASNLINKLESYYDDVKVVDDVITQPTYAEDLANFIWLNINCYGEFNYTTCLPTSMYDFALDVANVFQLDKDQIKPAKLSDFPDIAPRPKNTTYNLHHLSEMLGYIVTSPADGLQRMKNERH